MNIPRVRLLGSLAWCLMLWVGVTGSPAAEKEVPVSLKLLEATAEKFDDGKLLISCRVLLDNRTGDEITVTSNFGSPFDGIEIILSDTEGKVITRQGYTFHQSPYGPKPQEIEVQPGRTAATLVFPLTFKGKVGMKFGVQLSGLLQNSGPKVLLATERAELVVGAR